MDDEHGDLRAVLRGHIDPLRDERRGIERRVVLPDELPRERVARERVQRRRHGVRRESRVGRIRVEIVGEARHAAEYGRHEIAKTLAVEAVERESGKHVFPVAHDDPGARDGDFVEHRLALPESASSNRRIRGSRSSPPSISSSARRGWCESRCGPCGRSHPPGTCRSCRSSAARRSTRRAGCGSCSTRNRRSRTPCTARPPVRRPGTSSSRRPS